LVDFCPFHEVPRLATAAGRGGRLRPCVHVDSLA
jgi:hypothetical protein